MLIVIRDSQSGGNGARAFDPLQRIHRKGGEHMKDKVIHLEIEELEERIAPSNPPGQLGYEGQPGNQGGH